MVSKLDPNDFRAHRTILDPSDFALGSDVPDPPPTDLIREGAWNGIMTLPGDVAIRTSSYQGSRVELLYDLWSGWIEAFPPQGILADAMLDSADDFAAALCNLVHGFYKQSISSLRNALETMVFACGCELSADFSCWGDWQKGEELRFATVFEKFRNRSELCILEDKARQQTGASIIPFNPNDKGKAWARNLYQRLGKFSHARGDSTNGYLWESNGPVYSADGMRLAYLSHLETYALLFLIARIVNDKLEVPAVFHTLYESDNIKKYLDPSFHNLCLFYSSVLIPELKR